MKATLFCVFSLLSIGSAQSWVGLPGSEFRPENAFGYATWPPSNNVGQPLQPQTPSQEVQDLLAEIDPKRVKAIIQKLASFGTRHTLSNQTDPKRGIGAARDWILQQMQQFAEPTNGRTKVYFNSYIQPVASRILFPVNITNVVTEIPGSLDPNRVYVVTGHYDSRRVDINDYTGDAPGADDDASGVAVVMEMARVCAMKRPKATMIFAAVAAEEQGLYGSNHLAQTLKNASRNVEGNWNNDIVGTGNNPPFHPINPHTVRLLGASILYPNVTSGTLSSTIGNIGGENDSPARNLGRFIAEIASGARRNTDMQVALIYRPDRFLRGGDHESFLSAGFPGVRFTEPVEDFRHQHQDPRVQDGTQYGDLIQFVDFDYVVRVARTNLVSMWSAANAPGLPQNVTIDENFGTLATDENTPLSILQQASKISWITGNDPLADRYELVWRPSGALQWSHSLDAGKKGTVTVELSKDDFQFGVRAVGKTGMKSPAVFPLPA